MSSARRCAVTTMVSSSESLLAAFDAAASAPAPPLPETRTSAADSCPKVIRDVIRDAINFVTSRIFGSLVEAVSASWRYCVGGFNSR
jgi:hypothetical protein